MKVTCVGTDPAALYLGILLRRKDPAHVVRFVETAGPGLPQPPAIVGNPLKPRQEQCLAGGAEQQEQAEGEPQSVIAEWSGYEKQQAVKGNGGDHGEQ